MPQGSFSQLLAIAFAVLAVAQAKVYKVSVEQDPGRYYLTKFCYPKHCYGVGRNAECTFQADWTNKNNASNTFILMNDDSTYPIVRGLSSCQDKISRSITSWEISDGVGSVTEYVQENFTAHWWFVDVVNCEKKIDADFTLTFKQHGSQLGFDEVGMLEMVSVFFCIYAIIVAALCFMKKFSFFTYKVSSFVGTAALIQALALLISLMHWVSYKTDGEGIIHEGNWLREVAVVVLINGVMVGAAGWNSTTIAKLDKKPRQILYLCIGGISILYIVLLFWSVAVSNEWWYVDYLYETTPGAVLMAVRLLLAIVFALFAYRTTTQEMVHARAVIYKQFSLVSFTWLSLVPIFSFIGFGIVSYYQMRAINGITLSLDTLAIGLLLLILRPGVIDEHFTTQPGASNPPPASGLQEVFLETSNDKL